MRFHNHRYNPNPARWNYRNPYTNQLNWGKRPQFRGRLGPDWLRRWNPQPEDWSKPVVPWSRPISALAAGNDWFDPPPPDIIKSPKLLVVGGDPSFIPDWIIHSGVATKHFRQSEKSFYEALGDFEPDAILIFVKATTGHTKHQASDYGRKHKIPVLILSMGWGELMLSAKAQKVNWLVDL